MYKLTTCFFSKDQKRQIVISNIQINIQNLISKMLFSRSRKTFDNKKKNKENNPRQAHR